MKCILICNCESTKRQAYPFKSTGQIKELRSPTVREEPAEILNPKAIMDTAQQTHSLSLPGDGAKFPLLATQTMDPQGYFFIIEKHS